MSPMPVAPYHAPFLTTVNNKWRIRHVLTLDNSTSHRRNIQSASSSFIATSSINLNKAISTLNQKPNHATRATLEGVGVAVVVQELVPTETSMSELEKKRKRGFWFRDWDKVDLINLSMMITKHVLAVWAPFVVTWGAFKVAVILSFFTSMGVTLGYHRLLTHWSFKVPKWFEYFIAYCGVHAGEQIFKRQPLSSRFRITKGPMLSR